MSNNFYYIPLQNRGLIRVSGADRRPFLQGLVSNDIYLLDRQACVYACLLTAQGKFAHDFFITEKDGVIFIDCEGGKRAEELSRTFLMYKLRSKVEIACEKNIPVYSVFGKDTGAPDPRHAEMGFRSLEKPSLEEKPFDVWDKHRILLTIPDGSRDMIPDKSTLLESNIDKLNGVSFEKGCYVGQELTARMHHRGLAKKHLYTIHLSSPRKRGPLETAEDPRLRGESNMESFPAPGEEIRINDELIGEMRSSCGDAGLALLKDEKAEKLKL